jgi:hypothetical protein
MEFMMHTINRGVLTVGNDNRRFLNSSSYVMTHYNDSQHRI